MLLHTLSLRQPWAHAVIHLGKPFENREWKPTNHNRKFRGTFLIHASQSCTKDDQNDYEDMLWRCGHFRGMCERSKLLKVPQFGQLERGGIVGIADVVGAVTAHDMGNRAKQPAHEWYNGGFALELANVHPLPFTPCNGMLGFFHLDTTILGLDRAILNVTKNHITTPTRVAPNARAH